jgi:hypothetical protein
MDFCYPSILSIFGVHEFKKFSSFGEKGQRSFYSFIEIIPQNLPKSLSTSGETSATWCLKKVPLATDG